MRPTTTDVSCRDLYDYSLIVHSFCSAFALRPGFKIHDQLRSFLDEQSQQIA